MTGLNNGPLHSIKNAFQNAVRGVREKISTAIMDNVERSSENLRNFKTALFNFKAASIIQQSAYLLRIGAGIAMTAVGFTSGETILSMSGPFVAVSGFDKMVKLGEDFRASQLPANDDSACCQELEKTGKAGGHVSTVSRSLANPAAQIQFAV